MSDPTLLKHYNNLLIALSREHVLMITRSKRLRSLAELETSAGKKSGLYCEAKAVASAASRLKDIIQKNRLVLSQLFGTTNVATIAQQPLR